MPIRTLLHPGILGGFLYLTYFWWASLQPDSRVTTLGFAALAASTVLYIVGMTLWTVDRKRGAINVLGPASVIGIGAFLGGLWG